MQNVAFSLRVCNLAGAPITLGHRVERDSALDEEQPERSQPLCCAVCWRLFVQPGGSICDPCPSEKNDLNFILFPDWMRIAHAKCSALAGLENWIWRSAGAIQRFSEMCRDYDNMYTFQRILINSRGCRLS
jgi:hypothetical protein